VRSGTPNFASPSETPSFKFEDAARAGADFIADEPGAFDRVFLFAPYAPGKQVFKLYPRDLTQT
jgi:hypothetical protein